MKILALSAFLPFPADSGGRRRLFNIYDRLRQNHQITLLAPLYSAEEVLAWAELQDLWPQVKITPVISPIALRQAAVFSFGSKLRRILTILNPLSRPWFLKEDLQISRLVRDLLRSDKPDLLVIEFTQMAQYLPADLCIPSILVELDLSYISWRRRYQAAASKRKKLVDFTTYVKLKRFELDRVKKFSRVVVMSEKDAQILGSVIEPARIVILPNGVDVDYFEFREQMGEITSLINVGWFGHYPNLDAAQFFVGEIWPIIQKKQPGLSCSFVGKYQEGQISGLRGHNLNFLGYVEDFRPLLANSVFVVPLRIGGGTRLKILEAMAAGCPVVSTSIGAEGIEVVDGQHLLIADSPTDFAEAIQRLVSDRGLRERIRRGARKLIEEKYGWEEIVAKQENLYRELINDRR